MAETILKLIITFPFLVNSHSLWLLPVADLGLERKTDHAHYWRDRIFTFRVYCVTVFLSLSSEIYLVQSSPAKSRHLCLSYSGYLCWLTALGTDELFLMFSQEKNEVINIQHFCGDFWNFYYAYSWNPSGTVFFLIPSHIYQWRWFGCLS